MHIFLRNNTHSLCFQNGEHDFINQQVLCNLLFLPDIRYLAIFTFSTSMLCDLTMSQKCLKSQRIQIWMIILIWFYMHNVVGCNLSYENFGEETEPKTVYWTGSASSGTECRELCSSDINCAGCGYNDELDQCTKSNSTSVKSSSEEESHFYKKKCDSGTLGPLPLIYLKPKSM